jgi:hypothetical protein
VKGLRGVVANIKNLKILGSDERAQRPECPLIVIHNDYLGHGPPAKVCACNCRGHENTRL